MAHREGPIDIVQSSSNPGSLLLAGAKVLRVSRYNSPFGRKALGKAGTASFFVAPGTPLGRSAAPDWPRLLKADLTVSVAGTPIGQYANTITLQRRDEMLMMVRRPKQGAEVEQ